MSFPLPVRSPRRRSGWRWIVPLLGGIACRAVPAGPAMSMTMAPPPSPAGGSTPQAPAELVTMLPFADKPNATAEERTKVVIAAEVDGYRGNFILDTGDPDVDLNRTFLQPRATEGVDSVTDATRLADPGHDQPVWVVLHLGTVVDRFAPPLRHAAPPHTNALLGHAFGNYYNFKPRLGNIGLAALEPFETIVDYRHRRVVFIRLDAAGAPRATVPGYQAAHRLPLVEIPAFVGWLSRRGHYGLRARIGGQLETVILDTGDPGTDQERQAAVQLRQALATGDTVFDLDTVTAGSLPQVFSWKLLGYPFLQQLGIVGFNFRRGEFTVYRSDAAVTP